VPGMFLPFPPPQAPQTPLKIMRGQLSHMLSQTCLSKDFSSNKGRFPSPGVAPWGVTQTPPLKAAETLSSLRTPFYTSMIRCKCLFPPIQVPLRSFFHNRILSPLENSSLRPNEGNFASSPKLNVFSFFPHNGSWSFPLTSDFHATQHVMAPLEANAALPFSR